MDTPTVAAIIDRNGVSTIAESLGVPAGTVRMWKQRSRIPPEHWRNMATAKMASLEELAATVARPVGSEAA